VFSSDITFIVGLLTTSQLLEKFKWMHILPPPPQPGTNPAPLHTPLWHCKPALFYSLCGKVSYKLACLVALYPEDNCNTFTIMWILMAFCDPLHSVLGNSRKKRIFKLFVPGNQNFILDSFNWSYSNIHWSNIEQDFLTVKIPYVLPSPPLRRTRKICIKYLIFWSMGQKLYYLW
jgi:hypothetical protein